MGGGNGVCGHRLFALRKHFGGQVHHFIGIDRTGKEPNVVAGVFGMAFAWIPKNKHWNLGETFVEFGNEGRTTDSLNGMS